jgi:hypothetical protein
VCAIERVDASAVAAQHHNDGAVSDEVIGLSVRATRLAPNLTMAVHTRDSIRSAIS